MAAITSAAAGNWSATGTWSGGVVPGDGDTATVNHAVTVDVNTVVGSAPATGGTAAIAVNAALTVATGVTLEVKGDVSIANVLLTMAAGAIIEGNPATGVQYFLNISTAHNQATSRLVCNGIVGSRCIVRKKAGALGVFALRDSLWLKGGKITATFTDFADLGSATVPGWQLTPTGPELYLIEDCTWTGCGRVWTGTALQAGSKFEIRRTVWSGSLHADSLVYTATAAITSGSRVLDRCAFDKNLNMNARDVLMTECRMRTMSGGTAGPAFVSGSGNNVLFTPSTTGGPQEAAPSRWYMVNESTDNPHWLTMNASADQTLDQFIIESTGTPTNGDALIPPNPTVARTYNLRRCYLLPNPNGTSPGKLAAMLGNANVTVSVEHCTAVVGGSAEQGVSAGETYAGHVGMISSVKSNLFWAISPPSPAYFLTRDVAGSVQDIASAVNVDYNGVLGLSAGSDGGGVNASAAPNFFSTTNAHQLNGVTLSADPFVDRTRNLAAWGASKGGAGTYADTRDKLLALEPGWNVADLLDWVMAGFDVTDASLDAAGHDGVTIGAGAFVSVGVSAGIASETETALPAAPVLSVSAALAADTETALPVTAQHVVPVGPAIETTLGLGVAAVRSVATGLATESDTGLAVAPVHQVSAGLAIETDVALPVVIQSAGNLGIATETETALPVAVRKVVPVGLAVETEVSLSVAAVRRVAAGLANEADAALAATTRKQVPAGLASETDSALGSGAVRQVPAGVATEVETGLPAMITGAVNAGLAVETSTALPVQARHVVPVGIAIETDTVLSVLPTHLVAVGLASTLATAIAALPTHRVGAGFASELASALAVSPIRRAPVGFGLETDIALAVLDANAILFGPSSLVGVAVRSPVFVLVALSSPTLTSVQITPEASS